MIPVAEMLESREPDRPDRRGRPPLGSTSVAFQMLAVVLAALGLAALWAGVVTGRALAALDPSVSAAVVAARPSWLARLGVIVSNVGSPGVMIALTVVVALIAARRMRHYTPLVVGGGALVLLGVANLGLKTAVARPRPPVTGWAMSTSGLSFPSGHAVFSAGALLVCLLVLRCSRSTSCGRRGPVARWATIVTAVLAVVAVGGSRLVVGVHYPSDVLAGWAVAVLVVGAVALLTQWWTLRPHADRIRD